MQKLRELEERERRDEERKQREKYDREYLDKKYTILEEESSDASIVYDDYNDVLNPGRREEIIRWSENLGEKDQTLRQIEQIPPKLSLEDFGIGRVPTIYSTNE